jgi:RNA polymerase sigma-70 factor (ECF subfamily)
MLQMPALAHAVDPPAVAVPSFDEVYEQHAAFVWRVLRTFGVSDAQIEDAVQDVFVVVHRRLAEWEGRAAITTWLFAIARRVASHYRRAAGRAQRTEAIDEAAPIVDAASTFEEASRNEAAALLVEVLAELDDAKRELLILVELEQIPIPDVAAHLGVPLNTAYSRLRLARKAFTAALAKRRTKGTSP